MVAPTYGQYGHAVADELNSDPPMRRDPFLTRETTVNRRDSQIRRAPNASGLYDVLDLILDKGIVIDAFVRVSLVGIELLTVDLRVVIASVDTYLRYAEGVERLQVYNRSDAKRLPDMVGSAKKTGAVKKGAETVGRVLTGKSREDEEEDEGDEGEQDKDQNEGLAGTVRRGVRNVVGRLVDGIAGSEEDDDSGHGEHEERHHRPRREERERREGREGERRAKPKPAGARR